MADTKKIIGIYENSMESHVKDIVSQLDSTYSVDVEAQSEFEEVALKHSVNKFPTFIMFKNGAKLSVKIGKYNINDYKQWVVDYGWHE